MAQHLQGHASFAVAELDQGPLATGAAVAAGPAGQGDLSGGWQELVETEARRILDQCHDQARDTLRTNRQRLDALVEALLGTETLDAADACRAAGVPMPAEPEQPTEAPDVVRR